LATQHHAAAPGDDVVEIYFVECEKITDLGIRHLSNVWKDLNVLNSLVLDLSGYGS